MIAKLENINKVYYWTVNDYSFGAEDVSLVMKNVRFAFGNEGPSFISDSIETVLNIEVRNTEGLFELKVNPSIHDFWLSNADQLHGMIFKELTTVGCRIYETKNYYEG